MGKRIQTGFLFARPSFLSGMASAFDLCGQLTEYNESENPEQADANAIFSDWCMVGQDMMDAIEHYSVESEVA